MDNKRREDVFVVISIFLIGQLISTIDNDEYGEKLYNDNIELFNNAIDFYKKYDMELKNEV